MRLLAAVTAVLAVVVAAIASLPAWGSDTGSVAATVTAASPCITLNKTTIDFGTKPFSSSGSLAVSASDITPSITNCSAQAETILAHGTNATATNVSWSLVFGSPSCPNLNQFGMYILDRDANNASALFLTTIDATWTTIPANIAHAATFSIYMPCTGSGGAGSAVSFTYAFTATF